MKAKCDQLSIISIGMGYLPDIVLRVELVTDTDTDMVDHMMVFYDCAELNWKTGKILTRCFIISSILCIGLNFEFESSVACGRLELTIKLVVA